MSLFLGELSAAVTLNDSDYQKKLTEIQNVSLQSFEKIRLSAERNLELPRMGFNDVFLRLNNLSNDFVKKGTSGVFPNFDFSDFGRYLSDILSFNPHFEQFSNEVEKRNESDKISREIIDKIVVLSDEDAVESLSSVAKNTKDVARFSQLTLEEIKNKKNLSW